MERLKKLIEKPVAKLVILVAVLVGFAATAFSGMPLVGETPSGEASELETRLCAVLEAIEGVGEVRVMVTLSQDGQGDVAGVAVVCEGAGDPVIRERIVETVKTVLNIGADDVYVTKLMNQVMK